MTSTRIKNRYFRASNVQATDSRISGKNAILSSSSGHSNTPSIEGTDAFSENYWIFDGNASIPQGNSERTCKYNAIQSAIYTMASLPESHSFHVHLDAVIKASDLLGMMWENFDVEPPKVMPQDNEAVVFTWDHGNIKRYVTVDDEDVDVMDLHKGMQVKCVHEIQVDNDRALSSFIKTIGLLPSSATVDRDA